MTDATPEIIEEIAQELGIDPKQVDKAAKHQFKFAAKVMSDDKFRTLHLSYLGKFKASKSKLKAFRKLQLEGKIGKTKSGRDKVVNRPDNYDDINQIED